ncbi:hypothetical protein QQF64_031460 [Cirrhinus molitorella]|uniref:Uncharacterized protein n=1 Tax=Cirrhinus molitorella TaxID=172907 RepID=A0ABR3MWZ9_9TELE
MTKCKCKCSPDSSFPGSTLVTERKTDQHKGSGSSLLRLSPQRSPVRGVHPGVLCAGYDHGAVRCHSQLSLLDRANYHHPVDLPDTTGLSWREGILRCLESVQPRSRSGPESSPAAAPTSTDPLSFISTGPFQHP